MSEIVVKKGTKIEEFWKLFSQDAYHSLFKLEFDGRIGVRTLKLPEFGNVEFWLDETTAGNQLGKFVQLSDIVGEDGFPIILAKIADGSDFTFDGSDTYWPL